MSARVSQPARKETNNMTSGGEIRPAQVAMLVKGDEVYGVGTVEKLYAEFWPETTFVCLEKGAMYDWLRERRLNVFLVEGMARMHDRNSLATIVSMPLAMRGAKRDARRIHEKIADRRIRVIHAHLRTQQ